MILTSRQQQLAADLLLIDDAQERLAAVIDRARRTPGLPLDARNEDTRVKGCVSRAWVACDFRDGRCHFRGDADSPLVRGLVALLCEIYDGATPREVVDTEPALLEELGLTRSLSPSRANGLVSVRAKIREFAAAHAGPP